MNSLVFAQNRIIKEIDCKPVIDSAILTRLFFRAFDENKFTENDYIRIDSFPSAIISGKHNIPTKYMKDVVLALSFFPELADSRIVFKYKNIKGTMNARPDIFNFFRHSSNRRYLLIINTNEGKFRGVYLDSISVNARVGWFGHELAHIYTYYLMNNYQTLLFSVRYMTSPRFVKKTERYTNSIAIDHGLAFAIYEGEKYLLMDMFVQEYYKKRTIYRSLTLNEYKCLWFKFILKHMLLQRAQDMQDGILD
jgi:hypothetical protein